MGVPCVTVNKMCGSGMKAMMLGHDALVAGSASVVAAGGLESMTNAPYILDRARSAGAGLVEDPGRARAVRRRVDRGGP